MKGKVLIVDDEEDIRTLLSAVLDNEYQLSEAASGAALQKALAGEDQDVVLLDVKLGDLDGLDLIPQIKKQWPDAQVIVLTGHGKDLLEDEKVQRAYLG